tara:strand:+ start:220 stop:678 length:459 start_codon:yes stop_codon:yes gene_type:complete
MNTSILKLGTVSALYLLTTQHKREQSNDSSNSNGNSHININGNNCNKGLHVMNILENQIETDSHETDRAIVRRTKFGADGDNELTVSEYQSKTSGYRSIDCSLHDIDLDTVKTRTRTLKLRKGVTVKSKTIYLRSSDGVHHEFVLYGPTIYK